MDKYEFNIKARQIRKLVRNGEYDLAQSIADTIDWRRVGSVSLLTTVAEVYEQNKYYDEAREILLIAYEKAPGGKSIIYKLTIISIERGEIEEAEEYYREFYSIDPSDNRQHLLRYLILKSKNASTDQLIHALEQYINDELSEKWMYELAMLYHGDNRSEDCVKMCDDIMLLFGTGKYADKAMELKTRGEGRELNAYQKDLLMNREKYETKLREIEDNDSKIQVLDDTGEIIYDESNIDEIPNKESNQEDINQEENSDPHAVLPSVDKPSHASYIISADDMTDGLAKIKDILRHDHERFNISNKVQKIDAKTLCQLGLSNSKSELVGCDLVVTDAAMLDDDTAMQLMQFIQEEDDRIIIITDSAINISELMHRYPGLALQCEMIDICDTNDEKSESDKADALQHGDIVSATVATMPQYIEPDKESTKELSKDHNESSVKEDIDDERDDIQELSVDDFAKYAIDYAKSIDCSISGKSTLALYEKISVMEEDNIPLTKKNAILIIEEAADKAEAPSFGKKISGLFSARYDKDGLLIINEGDFF